MLRAGKGGVSAGCSAAAWHKVVQDACGNVQQKKTSTKTKCFNDIYYLIRDIISKHVEI